jgi:hypothetical protein
VGLLTAAVLAFESLVILLALPVALHVDHRGGGVAWILLALAVVTIVAAGLVRRRGGLWVGSVVQVLVLACGFSVPALGLIGALFALLWVAAIVVGRRGEALRTARAAAPTPGGPSSGSAT